MSPSPHIPKPTAAELNVLRTLWQLGPSPVKRVYEEQRRERTDLAYSTVLRLMQVMHGKGLLNRDESERSHVYAPAQERAPLQSSLLDDLISKVFAGSGKDLVLTALRSGRVSEAERAEIQSFLAETSDD